MFAKLKQLKQLLADLRIAMLFEDEVLRRRRRRGWSLALEAELRLARQEERERCAKAVEDTLTSGLLTPGNVRLAAAAIRALGDDG